MRVLHVYKLYSPFRGGGIAAAEAIIEGLADRAQPVVLSALPRGVGYCERVGAARVRRTSSLGYVNSMPVAPTLPFWFRSEARHSDLIHIHLPFPLADLALLAHRPKAPLILHWHSDIIQQQRAKKMLRPILIHSLRMADRIIVGSERFVQNSEDLQQFKDKCAVIPYGVDVDHWQSIEPGMRQQIDSLRQQFPRMVLFIGRLVAYKGLSSLLRSMVGVAGQLMIAGAGPLDEQLRRQANELGVSDKVRFLGPVSNDELKALYHAAKVFVLPSIWNNEAFGLSQLEAMACQKPVVNTELSTSVPWVARHEQEALTVQPDRPDHLARAITRLLDNPNEAQRLGAAGYQRARTVFDRARINEHIYTLYQDLLEARQPRGRRVQRVSGSRSSAVRQRVPELR